MAIIRPSGGSVNAGSRAIKGQYRSARSSFRWEQARGSGARSPPHAPSNVSSARGSPRLPTKPKIGENRGEVHARIVMRPHRGRDANGDQVIRARVAHDCGRRDLSDVLDDDAERPAMLDVEQRVVRLDQRRLPCIDAHVSMAMMMLMPRLRGERCLCGRTRGGLTRAICLGDAPRAAGAALGVARNVRE
jgi:hypothetical protein